MSCAHNSFRFSTGFKPHSAFF